MKEIHNPTVQIADWFAVTTWEIEIESWQERSCIVRLHNADRYTCQFDEAGLLTEVKDKEGNRFVSLNTYYFAYAFEKGSMNVVRCQALEEALHEKDLMKQSRATLIGHTWRLANEVDFLRELRFYSKEMTENTLINFRNYACKSA